MLWLQFRLDRGEYCYLIAHCFQFQCLPDTSSGRQTVSPRERVSQGLGEQLPASALWRSASSPRCMQCQHLSTSPVQQILCECGRHPHTGRGAWRAKIWIMRVAHSMLWMESGPCICTMHHTCVAMKLGSARAATTTHIVTGRCIDTMRGGTARGASTP